MFQLDFTPRVSDENTPYIHSSIWGGWFVSCSKYALCADKILAFFILPPITTLKTTTSDKKMILHPRTKLRDSWIIKRYIFSPDTLHSLHDIVKRYMGVKVGRHTKLGTSKRFTAISYKILYTFFRHMGHEIFSFNWLSTWVYMEVSTSVSYETRNYIHVIVSSMYRPIGQACAILEYKHTRTTYLSTGW